MSSSNAGASSEPRTRVDAGAHSPALALVAIPPGALEMRDARSESSRHVTLRAFEIGRTPVTRAEWDAVAGNSASAGAPSGSTSASTSTSTSTSTLAPAHPVTWFDAVRWCNAASVAAGFSPAYGVDGRDVKWHVDADGYRLPTEAEWEWSSRAGTLGPTYGPLPEIAWTAVDDVSGPQDVALKQANAFGLFDTIGNVWEWCWDYADTARYADYRSLRGGGWADQTWSCRASVRRGSAPDAVLEDVGFRVARGPVGEANSHAAQGWSRVADLSRADIRGPLPVGWTPLRPPTS
ncbi:formylglycine-generating enzyme family protein [Leifsonia sp. YAF41]|uniref:formylglycine-generating enzyme family protein n=1 Tax=Leifsonia sp. YAF41 TaxID=3233086 RepID=UPI003F9C11BD